jgi:hypothetical protein
MYASHERLIYYCIGTAYHGVSPNEFSTRLCYHCGLQDININDCVHASWYIPELVDFVLYRLGRCERLQVLG